MVGPKERVLAGSEVLCRWGGTSVDILYRFINTRRIRDDEVVSDVVLRSEMFHHLVFEMRNFQSRCGHDTVYPVGYEKRGVVVHRVPKNSSLNTACLDSVHLCPEYPQCVVISRRHCSSSSSSRAKVLPGKTTQSSSLATSGVGFCRNDRVGPVEFQTCAAN